MDSIIKLLQFKDFVANIEYNNIHITLINMITN